jgi:hypothetical protein
MQKWILRTCILAGCFSFASLSATAQEVVHALTGTVSSVDPGAKTITVFTDNHSEGHFKDLTNSKLHLEFNKQARAEATAADTFTKTGAYVVVYYFGDSDVRTAVAIRNLGPGPFTRSSGTVVKFEGKQHSISIKDKSGAIQSFTITADTVAETSTGAVEGFKFQAQKGDRVQVTAAEVNGNTAALFINTMVAD